MFDVYILKGFRYISLKGKVINSLFSFERQSKVCDEKEMKYKSWAL